MKNPVKDKLRRFGLLARFDERHFYVTIGQAVDAYVESSGIAWEDWEERQEYPRRELKKLPGSSSAR
jgi:hypothetical protein